MGLTGGCLCGEIRFETTAPPANPHLCSCAFCRHHTGAAAVAWVEFPAEHVLWTGAGGKPAVYRSSVGSSRAFCPRCGSSLGALDDAPVVALLVGCFDDPSAKGLAPEYHSFEDGLPDWAKT